jgi:hypothetical protein
MKTPVLLLSCVALICLTSGCVTGTRSLGVNVAPAEAYAKGAPKGPIGIGNISDLRQFENKPGDPSTPSIDGDVNTLSPERRSTYIGRQRNTFGHAMGDIALPAGQTVQVKVSDLLREGLKRRGYEVVDASTTENRATLEIQQFWSWMTPGFFALSFEAQIKCKVTISKDGKPVSVIVKGYGLNHGQLAKNVNWQEAFDIAFADFLKNLDEQADAAGL